MAIATYSDLKAAVALWLMRDDLGDAIPMFISLAEERMNNELRVSQMEVTATSTMVDGAVPLPSDFLEVRRLMGDGQYTDPLEPVTPGYAGVTFIAGAAGPPWGYTITGNVLTTYPDGGSGALTMVYYAKIPPLTDDNPTNWLLTRSPGAYLYGALLDSAPFLMDDARTQTWSALFSKALSDLQAADDRGRYGSGVMRVQGPTP